MPAEEYDGYFRNFSPEKIVLPGIDLEEMLLTGQYYGAKVLVPYLEDALNFLCFTPGRNKLKRQEKSPDWFQPWIYMLGRSDSIHDDVVIREDKRPILWNKIAEYIKESGEVFGLFNVAGGEGHEGHRYVARQMMNRGCNLVWAFENDEYNKRYKARGGTFLDLRVRLSMWLHYGIRLVTVMPTKPDEIKTNDWYDSLFYESSAHTYFVTSDDPHSGEKMRRILPGYEYINNLIPEYRPGSTTDRVMKIQPDLYEDDSDDFSVAVDNFLPELLTKQIDCTLV